MLSVVLIASVFFRVRLGGGALLTPRFDFARFLSELPGHLGWIVPFALAAAAMLPLRALQWQATLPKPVSLRERYHLVAIGAFVHNVVPGKLGDVFRAFVMARTQRLPFVQALGSVAVCKLFEFAALMLLVAASLLGPFSQPLERFGGALRVAFIFCIALVVLVVVLARRAGGLSESVRRRGRHPRLASFLSNVAVGLGGARSARGTARVLALSLPPVLAPALGYGLALQSVGVKGGLFAGAVMLGAIAVGQLAPGLPVATGMYYFVTSWTARSLGASPDDAAAFAVATHLSTVATQTMVGLVSVLVRRIRWRDLRRGTGAAAEALRHAAKEEAPARA
ncbi:MAG: flippase-like domain-containing protein [Myxococcales bacterium]|nr:flippase-like domain-containing protein [Myxococcales bacterium]